MADTTAGAPAGPRARRAAATGSPPGGAAGNGASRAAGTGSPPGGAAAAGLADKEVQDRIAELDRLLEYLEKAPGPVAGSAVTAVSLLTQVYGAALARVMRLAGQAPGIAAALAGDEVVGHLLILHGLHPQPPERRAAQAIRELQPYLRSHGGGAELLGIDGDKAMIRFSGSCLGCAATAATLRQAVTEAVLRGAPELAGTVPVEGPRSTEVIPAESLLRKPAGTAPAGGRRR
jgi:Fe-S cluster biogenesis protein NfuA